MTDPITALGGAAAATQFIACGIKICQVMCRIYGKVDDAPARVRDQIQQVEEMVSIVGLVERNSALQVDPQISSILDRCLSRAKKIQDRLKLVSIADRDGRMRKLKKNVSAVFNEKEIAAMLEDLERWNGLLIIRIENVDV